MYILFEGVDTCGKSTQIEIIKRSYPDIITTFEPGATEFGQMAREILLGGVIHSTRAELLLFLADRAEHYVEVVKPNRDKTIISDRGFLSGVGYALANGSVEFDELMRLNRFALDGDMPDKIVLFETDIETLQARADIKELDSIELRGMEYLLEVQRHMRETLERIDIEYICIDATESIETIHKKITQYLKLGQ